MGLLELAAMAEELEKHCGNIDTGSAEHLAEMGQLYLQKNEFHLGQLVTWKPGLKDSKWPAEGNPAVVVDLDIGALDPRTESSSPFFKSPKDIRIGMMGPTGDFDAWWADSNRLQPYTPE